MDVKRDLHVRSERFQAAPPVRRGCEGGTGGVGDKPHRLHRGQEPEVDNFFPSQATFYSRGRTYGKGEITIHAKICLIMLLH